MSTTTGTPPAAGDTTAATLTSDEHGNIELGKLTLAAEVIGQGTVAPPAVAEYALWLGDDALVLAQNLGWWISRAPELEEDIAIGNIALDLIGHARSFLSYAGSASGRTEDEMAYFRGEEEYRSAQLFEQANGDFAHTIARNFIAGCFQHALYERLQGSHDETLAAIAAKSIKEVDYHVDHATQWVLRLAGGTAKSRRRLIVGFADVWPYVDELFRDEPLNDELAGVAVRQSTLRPAFDTRVAAVFAEAELEVPVGFTATGGGRVGKHHETLGPLLAEMQVLARQFPGAAW
ncbi:phenylacetate-CoA oxygenase subunit PaaC [Klugiella xanthotipulae]|uniref:Ring-1,2-phenylacetyl-CoA epoxidase subunit PaaC n=1 Tax=Klugiella xanthotipulae TaxID=244735 RepID=A0A543I728_9MICO|nr:1,2-phenylacetyl-CoA epoxidase subunit PaaC [Klugiella xanthotipulae]TQM66416.1 ring-1,2-phenylacetyl-CoA epoxidase subunit PaaC [Klugiella xanthotipulae]